MPVSEAYVSSKLALIRLVNINDSLNGAIATINRIQSLEASVMSDVDKAIYLASYKDSIKRYVLGEIQRAASEAVVLALAGATESDQKNSLLTSIISGVIVNPASAANAIELAAMIGDGTNAVADLVEIQNNLNTILA